MICVSMACFATLGDGQKKTSGKQNLLAPKPTYNYKHFSLKSSYNYRGNDLLSTPVSSGPMHKMNTVITYKKGNTTYILPLKRNVVLDKVNFNPAAKRY